MTSELIHFASCDDCILSLRSLSHNFLSSTFPKSSLLLTDKTERTNLFSWFKAHHTIFFPDLHIADHFLVSFLGSLLPCGAAPPASAGQYL